MIVSLGFSAREDGGRECDYTLHAQYPTQEIKLHIIDEGDTYLVYAPLRQTVCRAQKTVFPFLEWELISWVSSEIYMLDIMDVATVSFKGNGTEALFELSGDVDLEVKCAGKSVDVEAFKKTYQAFMYVLVTDWGEEPEDAAELMHLTFTMESGEVLDYSFKAVTAVKSFYTLNGAGQFYIEREKVMEIRGLFEALIP
jgi:hypothetical protein